MKITRLSNCGCEEYQAYLAASDAIFDIDPNEGNVTLNFYFYGDHHGPAEISWTDTSRDLFDISAMIYIADELAQRGESWLRRFEFSVPVREKELWESHDEDLSELLRFLTGDENQFIWHQSDSHFELPHHQLDLSNGTYTAACMFSGGLDSLMGATNLLNNGETVLLIGHYADNKSSMAQRDLFSRVRQQFGNRVHLLQCSLARSKRRRPRYGLPEKDEDSHRARSFLFLSLGMAVSVATGIDKLFFAENGLIALNPPLGRSRAGSLSTRTAHPRFLAGFQRLVHSLGIWDGTLQNPFLYKSKSEITDGIEPWEIPLLSRSISCAHTTTVVRWAGLSVNHCGYCVPCIYRRLAMMTAGADRAQDYGWDTFSNLHELPKSKQVDMRLLSRRAKTIQASTRTELASMVVSHGRFSPSVSSEIGPYTSNSFEPWEDMLINWSNHFLDQIQALAPSRTKRILDL